MSLDIDERWEQMSLDIDERWEQKKLELYEKHGLDGSMSDEEVANQFSPLETPKG